MRRAGAADNGRPPELRPDCAGIVTPPLKTRDVARAIVAFVGLYAPRHLIVARKTGLAARGERQLAFDARCIPSGSVAPPSNTPGILGCRALPDGRLARLGATTDFHHGLLAR